MSGLRPWEYDNFEAQKYDEITMCQRTFQAAMKQARDDAEREAQRKAARLAEAEKARKR